LGEVKVGLGTGDERSAAIERLERLERASVVYERSAGTFGTTGTGRSSKRLEPIVAV